MRSSDDSPLPTFHLNGFEWRIFHRLAIPAGSLANLEDNQNKLGGQNEH